MLSYSILSEYFFKQTIFFNVQGHTLSGNNITWDRRSRACCVVSAWTIVQLETLTQLFNYNDINSQWNAQHAIMRNSWTCNSRDMTLNELTASLIRLIKHLIKCNTPNFFSFTKGKFKVYLIFQTPTCFCHDSLGSVFIASNPTCCMTPAGYFFHCWWTRVYLFLDSIGKNELVFGGNDLWFR